MDLKDRKAVANGALPKFNLGLSNLSWDTMQKLKIQNMSTNPGGALNFTGGLEPKLTTSASGLGSLGSGGMGSLAEKDPTKFFGLDGASGAAKPGGAGAFLKNNAGGIANAAMSAINFVGTIGDISKNKISSDEMMGSGGTSLENVNGINYTKSKVDEAGMQNLIDATAKAGTIAAATSGMATGAALGSIIPGLGTAVGGAIGGVLGGVAGLFGSSKAKEEAERLLRIARNRTQDANSQRRDVAYTIGLRNLFNRENETDTSQSLFHAEKGKEGAVNPMTMETYKKHIVNTAYGKMFAPLNAWVSDGEVIKSADGSLHRVKGGKNDTARAYLQAGDSVYSKKVINPETGNSIADDAASYAMAGQLDRLDMNLNVGRMMKYAGKRKPDTNTGYLGGTLKKYVSGDENIVPPPLEFTLQYYLDLPRANRPNNSAPDVIANAVNPETAGTYHEMPGMPTHHNVKSRFGAAPDDMPRVGAADKTSAITPEMIFAHDQQLRSARRPSKSVGSKTPGFLSKLWGGIKNVGSNIDLGNITQLANAYSIAAQRDARAEGIRAPKSFVTNQYEQDALQQLNKLHSDYYPVWAQNRELEARGKSAIALSGGLSAGQRMLGYMGLANKMQQNNAAALFEHQGRENALRAQAANAALQAGQNAATRQQQAYQWDEDMLAKAHAARENMLETSAYDRQNALTQFFKNAWEKNQFDRTMNLYETDQKMSESDREFYRNQFIKNNKPAAPTAPTLADKAASTVTAAGAASIHPSQVAPTSAVPTIKVQAPQPAVKPTTKRGKKAAAGVKKSAGKGKSVTSSIETSSVTAKPVATSYTPYAFGNPAIQERFPNASAEAKLARPNKEKAGRPAPTSNAEALSRLWEKIKLGKKEYERRYGKGS